MSKPDREVGGILLIWISVFTMFGAIGLAGLAGLIGWLVVAVTVALVAGLARWTGRESRLAQARRAENEARRQRMVAADAAWSARMVAERERRLHERILSDQEWERLARYWARSPLSDRVGYTRVADRRRGPLQRYWDGHYLSTWDGRSFHPVESVAEPARVDEKAAPQDLRDPLWSETVERESARRRALVRRMSDIAARLDGLGPDAVDAAGRTYRECAVELARTLATVSGLPPVTVSQARDRLLAWVAVPAGEVVDLARPVRALCDCRFGHFGYHAIVGHDRASGAVTRECAYCEPATRWREGR